MPRHTHRQNISIYLLSAMFIFIGSFANAANEKDVQKFFSKNKVGISPDYAFVKNGIAGPDHLITIHGFANDRLVCEALAREYNGDSSLSTLPGIYQCIQLNE